MKEKVYDVNGYAVTKNAAQNWCIMLDGRWHLVMSDAIIINKAKKLLPYMEMFFDMRDLAAELKNQK